MDKPALVSLTFDDGLRCQFEQAVPILDFEARQSAQAPQVSNFGEILTGVQSVSDPMTGSQFQVYSGPKANYYINGNGVKINSNVSPGPGFHQLTPVQP